MRFLRLALVVAVTAVAVGGTTVDAATRAVGCGAVITQSTTLSSNLRGCTSGLVLAGDGITVDLAGHTISGGGAPDTRGAGITVTGQDVTIKNGVIASFATGVSAAPPTPVSPRPSVRLQSLKIVGNNLGVLLDRLGTDAPASSIDSSQIAGNATTGVAFDRTNLTMTNSSVRGNGSHGVSELEAVALFVNNDISQNGGDGIFASDVLTFAGGLFGNTLSGNGRNGYEYSQTRGDAYPHLENNRADRNARLGLFLSGNGGSLSNLDGGGNAAKSNGDVRQCVVQDAVNPVPPNALVCTKSPRG